MDPFTGQRWSEFKPERIAWHMFTVGVLALLLIVLLISVETLGDPPTVDSAPPAGARAPADIEHRARDVEAARPVGGLVPSAARRALAESCRPNACAAV